MKKGWLYFIFLLLTTPLFAQQDQTVFAHLKAGETIEIDWVHQQYLPDSGSVAGDYPLFPDQLKDGEGEMHARLKLEMQAGNQIKIWIAHIFTLQFPKRTPIDAYQSFYAKGSLEGALVFPIIEDTRYHFDAFTAMPDFYKDISKTPLIFDVNNGIMNKEWFNGVEENTKQTSLYFNAHHLEAFLTDFLSTIFIKKVGYQKTIQYQQSNKHSLHFYKPNLPPRKTVISGVIKNPIHNKLTLNYNNYESWSKRPWGGTKIELDSTGQFSFTVFLKEPSQLSLRHSFFPLPIYAEPGDSIKIEIDGNRIYRRTKFLGDNAINNEILLDFYHTLRGDTVMTITPDFSVLQKSQAVHLASMQQKEARELTYLASQKDNISVNFYSFLDRAIRFSNAIKLWHDASTFKQKRDIHLISAFTTYCQKLSKLLYRLPSNKEHDFAPEMYLIFQKGLLTGAFLDQRLPFRSLQAFELAKQLLTPDNSFRYGQLLLFLNQEKNTTTAFLQFHKNFEAACSQINQQQALKDYLLPKKKNDLFPDDNTFEVFELNEKAPNWAYPILSNTDTITLSDFKGDYLLLHIGLEQNLEIAKADIQEISANSKGEKALKVVHLIARQPDAPLKESTKEIVYLSYEEMELLRKDYLISNNANNYFAIDQTGRVMMNPFNLGTFNQLRFIIDFMKQPSFSWSIELTPESWRILGVLSLIFLTIAAIYTQRKRTLAKREQQKRQLVELELKGIRAQMNPHFLFNALSSIQNLIRKKEDIAADRYLTQFAGLVRKILRNSEQEFITLEEEIAAIKQYCSLEALRTPFDYEINIAEDIDHFNTYIPGMLLQPLIENAILHGLMPQKGVKNLWINIQTHPQGLACEIIDNGIGIHQAKQQQQRHKAHQKSFGMALIRQRIQLLVGQEGTDFLKTQDRSELNPPAIGTIVNLIIPIEK